MMDVGDDDEELMMVVSDDGDDLNHQLFAANRHLEAAVDYLTRRPDKNVDDHNHDLRRRHENDK